MPGRKPKNCESYWDERRSDCMSKDPGLGLNTWIRLRYLCEKLAWPASTLTDFLGRDMRDYYSRAKGSLSSHDQKELLGRIKPDKTGFRSIPSNYFTRSLFASKADRDLPWDDIAEGLGHLCEYGFLIEADDPGLQGIPPAEMDDRSSYLDGAIEALIVEMRQFLCSTSGPQVFAIYGEAGRGQSMLLADFLQSRIYAGFRICYIDCLSYSSYPQIVNYIYRVVFGETGTNLSQLYQDGMSDYLDQSLLERLIIEIGARLQKVHYLFVIDNFQAVQFSALTHVIRDDAIYELLKFVLLDSSKTKIIVASTHPIQDIVEDDVISRELLICPKEEVVSGLIFRYRGLTDVAKRELHDLIASINENHINRSELLLVYTLIRLNVKTAPEIKAVFDSSAYIRNRSDKLLLILVQRLPPSVLRALRVIALAEDRIKYSTLATILSRLGGQEKSEIKLTIEAMRKMLSPFVVLNQPSTKLSEDDSDVEAFEYSVSYHYRNALIETWENSDEQAIARKAHSMLAEYALLHLDSDPNQDVVKSIRELRFKFQAVMHLLASIEPDDLPKDEDSDFVTSSLDFFDAQSRLFDSPSHVDVLRYAYQYVKKVLELGGEHSLSRNLGADEEKMALYLRFFHPGFTRPPFGKILHDPDVRLPTLSPALSCEERAELLTSVAVSALRSHDFSVCLAATRDAKQLYEILRDHPIDPNDLARGDNQIAKIVKIQLDMLIRQGRLQEALTWALKQLHMFTQQYGKHRVSEIDDLLRFEHPRNHVYRALAPRVAEALFLQGSIRCSLDLYNKIIEGSESSELGLVGRSIRPYIRLMVRLARIEQDEEKRNYYTERAKHFLGHAKLQQKSHRLESDGAAIIMLESLIQRIDQRPYHEVLETMNAARKKIWAGRISPMLRLQMALENSRSCIYAAKKTTDAHERKLFLGQARAFTRRVKVVAKHKGYKLYECDASLLEAEITEEYSERAKLFDDIRPIIDTEYGLRNKDFHLLQEDSKASAVLDLVY